MFSLPGERAASSAHGEGNGYVKNSHDRSRRLRRSSTVILAVLAAGLVLAACGGTKNAGAKSTTTDPPAGSSTTAPASSSTTKPLTTPTTIPFLVSQVQKGTGPATLSPFTVKSNAKEWDIDWVFDCSKTTAKTGTFGVTVVGHGSASNTIDAGVPTKSGEGTAGIVKNYDVGTFNLKVASTCTWTVRVEVIN
jgi:hypothetical protein